MAGFESQNFDPMVRALWSCVSPKGLPSDSNVARCEQENDVEREFQIHRTEADYSLAEFWKWALALLIGVAMGVLGFLVDWGIEKLNNFKYNRTVELIQSEGEALFLNSSTGDLQQLLVRSQLDCIALRALLRRWILVAAVFLRVHQPRLRFSGGVLGLFCRASCSRQRDCGDKDVPERHSH